MNCTNRHQQLEEDKESISCIYNSHLLKMAILIILCKFPKSLYLSLFSRGKKYYFTMHLLMVIQKIRVPVIYKSP